MIGFLVLLLGAFPYWILGHVPTFFDWNSRHQLLLPLGSALVIVGALSLYNVRGKKGIISIFIGASLAFNVSNYAALFIDWQKQQQLMYLFAQNADIERAELIIFEDKTQHLNALERQIGFYECNGLLEAAFGNEKRFCIPRSELDRFLTSEYYNKFFSVYYKSALFRRDSALPAMLVEFDLVKVKSEHLRQKIYNKMFPKLTISVSEFYLK